MTLTPEDKKRYAELLGQDEGQWEKAGDLGKNPEHTRALSPEESAEFHAQKKTFTPTSIRLPKELIEELKAMSAAKGIGYQTYLRMILLEHIQKNKSA